MQVETQGNPVYLVPAVKNAIHEIDARLPVFDVRPMRESTHLASSFAVSTVVSVVKGHSRATDYPNRNLSSRYFGETFITVYSNLRI